MGAWAAGHARGGPYGGVGTVRGAVGRGSGEGPVGERRALVAGGTGIVGREVARALRARGWDVRSMSRRGEGAGHVRADVLRPETLKGICDGVDVVVSAVGASLDMRRVRDRSSYDRVDHHGNRALLEEASRAGSRRFVYVSVLSPPSLRELDYVRAHLRFEEALRGGALEWGIVRPTGLFAFFTEILDLARTGRGLVIGDGTARTNPVHERDVGEAVAAAVIGEAGVETEIGGPEVLSRREIVETAFAAVGRAPRIIRVPPGPFRVMAGLIRPINPRLSALLRFGADVSLVDAIGPATGRRRLADYFEERAGVGAGSEADAGGDYYVEPGDGRASPSGVNPRGV